ncbi:hypothetical protein C0Q70_15122 [Pomacea canaliculata]|uniref:Uncharacterized protein n=1 Tax=Pomacea canaliculata TaxID=400727 RepID=A0A2T7NTX7_POMCA|nr:hypothetical protein C0Q70_15122 [Pomacea canaliculata]
MMEAVFREIFVRQDNRREMREAEECRGRKGAGGKFRVLQDQGPEISCPSDVMSERGAIGRYKCAGQITGFELTLTARSPIVSLSQSER